MLLFALSSLAADLPDISEAPRSLPRDATGDVALIVAIDDYATLSNVDGALDNANAWDAWLSARGAAVSVLYDEQATKEQILTKAKALAGVRKKGGRAWLIYIGHGAPSRTGSGALVGWDAQSSCASLDARTVGQDEVIAALGSGPVVAVVDACFSGKTQEGSVMRGCQPAVPEDPVEPPAGVTVLRAASGTQYAGALPGEDRPAYSWLVLGGLRGWADGDADGSVTAAELTDWTRRQLVSMPTAETQTPEVDGAAAAVLAKAVEPDPNPAKVLRGRTAVSAATTSAGSIGSYTLSASDKLKEQQCEADAQAKGQALRAARVAAAVKAAQGETSAAWAKLAPEVEACKKLTDVASRTECAETVERFAADASRLSVTLPVGTESVTTSCGTRSPAFAAVTQAVSVAEVDVARAAAAVLRKAPTVAVARSGDWTSPTLGAMKWIPPGSFTMGSASGDSDETPHKVTLAKGYWMMEHEVTQGEWNAVMGSNPSKFSACGDSCPVETVSWDDAVAFAAKVSARDGVIYRLPTEAEWEYAARGGRDVTYAGSNEVGAVAWYEGNSGKQTHAVCGKARNGYGLCDMSGNVWEWAADWYGDYTGAATDPTGAATGSYRVYRGGSWFNAPAWARVASRFRYTPSYRYFNLGFRLVRSNP